MEAGPPGGPGQAAQGLVELVQERGVVSALGLTKLYMDSTAPGTRIRPRIAIQITVQVRRFFFLSPNLDSRTDANPCLYVYSLCLQDATVHRQQYDAVSRFKASHVNL